MLLFLFRFIRQNVSIAGIILREGDEKIIYKNQYEHTSPILNIYKEGNEFIVVTKYNLYYK